MKKLIIFLISFFSLTTVAFAQEFASNAKSAILMEYTTGKVLYEKNSNERLAPASMTKVMTLLLTMEAIDNGKLSFDSDITISQNASKMGGSQMFLEANTSVKLEELIKGVSIVSANDAAVALSEAIGGSEENFVKMMNEKAQELGLTNTNFQNPHGLDTEGHYTSAHDMAIMARQLIKYDNVLKYTSTYEDYFNKSDGSRLWLVNTNKLVRFYPGVDGLKTGFTDNAGYCLTATASKNSIRFITVLMGEPSSDLRSKETTELLNYAFNNYKLNTIIDNNQELGKIYVEKGDKDLVPIVVKQPITEVEEISSNKKNYSFNIKTNKVKAPLKQGDVVGTVEIKDEEGLIVREEQLTIKEDIKKISFIKLFINNFKILINGK